MEIDGHGGRFDGKSRLRILDSLQQIEEEESEEEGQKEKGEDEQR